MAIVLLLLLTLGFASLQAWVYGRWSVSRIRYTRQFNMSACYAGDTVELVEVIENYKPIPVFWLRVESTLDAALRFDTEEKMEIHQGKRTQYHKSLFTLGPYRRIRRKHKVLCAKRGIYKLASVSVVAGDLLGMHEKQQTYPVKAALTVYPQVVPMEDVPLPSHGWQGDVTVRRWIVEDPFMIAGVRDYRSGDPMKHIHWKASAKTGSLQVYQHDYTAEQRLVVYLNVEDKETTRDLVHDEELIEKGISYAATLVSEAVQQGLQVGFGHNGINPDEPMSVRKLPIGGGREHLLAILEEMARIELRCGLLFPDFLEADIADANEQRDYILITAHLSTALSERIARLQRSGHSVQVLRLQHGLARKEATA